VGRLLARGSARDRRLRHSGSRTIGEYNYHPPFPEPSHTFMPVPFEIEGRRIALAIDEEDHAHDEKEVERRRPAARLPVGARRHRPRAHQAAFDLRSQRTGFALEPRHARALRRAPVPGAHERHAGVLLLVRGRPAHRRHRRPAAPQEVGYFIPNRLRKSRAAANDVDVDSRGLVYIVDRYAGFDVLEFKR